VPTTTDVIADRRNELSGNISLNQELGFIEQVNEVGRGKLPADEFQQTAIRRIHMGKRFSRGDESRPGPRVPHRTPGTRSTARPGIPRRRELP